MKAELEIRPAELRQGDTARYGEKEFVVEGIKKGRVNIDLTTAEGKHVYVPLKEKVIVLRDSGDIPSPRDLVSNQVRESVLEHLTNNPDAELWDVILRALINQSE